MNDDTELQTNDSNEDALIGARYEKWQSIGVSLMAEVFEGFDRKLSQRVALKCPRKEAWIDPHARERLVKEAERQASLRHPHIARVQNVVEEGLGKPVWLVMDFVEGQSLKDIIRAEGGLAPRLAASLAIQMARALKAAHEAKIVHRDVKPSNVMVDSKGWVYLIDFGIAQVMQQTLVSLTGQMPTSGTPLYMAPEQHTGGRAALNKRVDVFAYGAVLYEMLTGEQAFGMATQPLSAKRERAYDPILDIAPQVPKRLVELVDVCLSPDPKDRPEDFDEIEESVRAAVPKVKLPKSPASPSPLKRPTCEVKPSTPKPHAQPEPVDDPWQALAELAKRKAADKARKEEALRELRAEAEPAFEFAKQQDAADYLTPKQKADLWQAYLAKFEAIGYEVDYARDRAWWWTDGQQLPKSKINPLDGSEMILCPAGTFKMGSNNGEDDEKPVHEVQVDSFYIGKYEVTNKQFKKFIDANPEWRKPRMEGFIFKWQVSGIAPEYHDGDYLKNWDGDSYPSGKADHPVVYVSWFAAKAYCEWAGGRLPTEAEWEYACRAGSTTKYCFGDDASHLGEYAWYYDNSGNDAHPVGRKKPNAWGIHDMHGNVWEWCSDWYDSDYYARSKTNNPTCATSGTRRVVRGGGWSVIDGDCRSALRVVSAPAYCSGYSGLRVCVSSRAPR